MKIFYYIRRFWEVSKIERKLFVNIILINLLTKFIVRSFPLKYYYFILKLTPSRKLKNNRAYFNAKFIYTTFRRLLKCNLISKNCLEKSLTLRLTLLKFGIPNHIVFSLVSDQNLKLKAHSYIEIPNENCFFKDYKFKDVISF
jgi:hypothetical protein